MSSGLAPFHPAVAEWFRRSFPAPTRAQALGWPAIARGESTLIFAPTGSGKTLTAFLWCLDRLMFAPRPPKERRCRVLYISPLKALAVDVERNLRAPLAGIAQIAAALGEAFVAPAISIRTGDTPQSERARFQREPADILITTPESLYLLLTSNAREALRSIDTIIVDEIHALVPTKRGAHLAISLERLEAICHRPPPRPRLGRRHAAVDLVGDSPAAPRADSRAPLDADLRQQPPPRRAARGRAERARGRDARAFAPRLDRAAAARRDRRPAQGRRAARP